MQKSITVKPAGLRKLEKLPVLLNGERPLPSDRLFNLLPHRDTLVTDFGKSVIAHSETSIPFNTLAIIEQPNAVSLYAGETLTISIRVLSNPACTYQLYKDGELVEGATSATYTKTAESTDVGEYYFVCDNGFNTVTSISVTINVYYNFVGNTTLLWELEKQFSAVAYLSNDTFALADAEEIVLVDNAGNYIWRSSYTTALDGDVPIFVYTNNTYIYVIGAISYIRKVFCVSSATGAVTEVNITSLTDSSYTFSDGYIGNDNKLYMLGSLSELPDVLTCVSGSNIESNINLSIEAHRFLKEQDNLFYITARNAENQRSIGTINKTTGNYITHYIITEATDIISVVYTDKYIDKTYFSNLLGATNGVHVYDFASNTMRYWPFPYVPVLFSGASGTIFAYDFGFNDGRSYIMSIHPSHNYMAIQSSSSITISMFESTDGLLYYLDNNTTASIGSRLYKLA